MINTARQVAYHCLQRIDHEGAYANLLLQSELGRSRLSERDRGFVTELVYGTTRMRRACDALIERFLIKEPQPALRTLLRLGAYQIHFARHDAAPPAVAWISLALGDRRGAGHDLEEAWQNYLGLSAPIISATERGTVLFEIRRHLVAADAALRRGDLEMFGRQWEAIKRLVGTP